MAKNLDDMLNKIDEKLDDVSDAIHKVDKEVALQKAAFDEHIKQDEKMYEEFKRMNDILQQNTDSLKEHMHRTDLLEDIVKKMDLRLSPIELERIEDEAVKKYRNSKLKKYGKVLGAIATAIGILAMLKPLLLKLLGL
jgi:thiaminase